MKRKRKGNAWAALAALLLLFVTTLTWMLMSNMFQPLLFPQMEQILSGHSSALDTLNILQMAWNNWPVVIVAGLVIYVIVAAQKEEPRYARR